MKTKLFVSLLLAIFVSACGGGSIQTEAGYATIEVPGYATNGAAMNSVRREVDPDGKSMDTFDWDATLTEGSLGLFIEEDAVDDTFGAYDFRNFGQTCGLTSYDEVTFDSETKTITAIFLASTNDQEFLRWCQNQVKKTMAVYVINVEEANEGFLILYHVEYWGTKVIFREK